MFSDDLIHSATELLQQCRKAKRTIATAESCTGGLVSALLTAIPGSSDVFMAGFVSYANEAKTAQLGVNPLLIQKHGAVSEEVVIAMAEGARERSHTSMAVAISGVAGPGGSTPDNPVGMVCIAVASPEGVMVETCQFEGDRHAVRLQSVAHALEMLAS